MQANSRLERLEQLKGLLASREHVTAAALADELGVSLRTISRDLEVLRSTGTPVESDRGRGGGLRLQQGWSSGRVHLAAEEAIDLLLAITIAERLQLPLLLDHLAPIRRKIVLSFPVATQKRIKTLRNRVLVASSASEAVKASLSEPVAQLMPAIARAFYNMHSLQISYRDQNGSLTQRQVEPHYLLLNMPAWYLLCWDSLRQGIRHFRLDRIEAAEELPRAFRPRQPQPFLKEVESIAGPI